MNRGRGSTRRWRKFRRKVLREEPLCRRCRASGFTVEAVTPHHIVPVHVDPSREFDRGNVEPLCNPCHDAEHRVTEPPAGAAAWDSRLAFLEANEGSP